MEKVSFIIRRCFIFVFVLGTVYFLPLSGSVVPNYTMVAKASQIDEDGSRARLNVKSLALVLEDSYKLRVRNVEEGQTVAYKSSDKEIASVKIGKDMDTFAKITANGVGAATITVTVKEGAKTVKTLKCEVVVGPAAQSVKFTKSLVELKVGEKTSLKAVLKPFNTTENPIFQSSDTELATVNSSGNVTAIAPGTVRITVSIANGVADACVVRITE